MASDDTKSETKSTKMSGLDILKNVGGALIIAFLLYWLPVLAEQFFSPTEIRYHHAKLGDLSGYLFSIQNFSRNPIDDLSIYIDGKIGVAHQDGAVSMEVVTSSNPSLVKLKNVAPHTDATLFITAEKTLDSAQIRVSSSSTITTFEDTKYVRRDLWSPSTFFSSMFTALLYLTFGLYMDSQRRNRASEIDRLRSDLKRLDQNADRFKKETEEKTEELKWRLMRARVQMLRHIARLNEEVAVWRRFFQAVYSSTFSSKGSAEPVLEILLKLSGVHMTKRIRDYSDSEFLTILEEADRNRGKSAKNVESPDPTT